MLFLFGATGFYQKPASASRGSPYTEGTQCFSILQGLSRGARELLSAGAVPPQTPPPLYMHADAEDKYERNQGARFKVEPVTDEAVIAQLHEETPEIPQGATFVHIVEVLPLG